MNGLSKTGSQMAETFVGADVSREPQAVYLAWPHLKRQALPLTFDPLDQDRLQRFIVERPQRRIETITKDIFAIQEPSDYVFFRRSTQKVIVNENGAFVPSGLFPPQNDIDFQIHRSLDGSVSVNVFSRGRHVANPAHQTAGGNDRSREMRWIAEHRDEYANQWVALAGDRLLSHGDDACEVYRRGRESGIDIPFIAHVEPLDTLPFGGW